MPVIPFHLFTWVPKFRPGAHMSCGHLAFWSCVVFSVHWLSSPKPLFYECPSIGPLGPLSLPFSGTALVSGSCTWPMSRQGPQWQGGPKTGWDEACPLVWKRIEVAERIDHREKSAWPGRHHSFTIACAFWAFGPISNSTPHALLRTSLPPLATPRHTSVQVTKESGPFEQTNDEKIRRTDILQRGPAKWTKWWLFPQVEVALRTHHVQ